MKKLLLGIIMVLGTISLNNFLLAYFNYKFNQQYEVCKQELIAVNNYKTTQQAVECGINKSVTTKALQILLWQ